MPPDYSRAAPPAPIVVNIPKNLALLALRVTTGSALLFWHGWREGFVAWDYIWSKAPWGLPPHLASMGFPFPVVLAMLLVVVTLVCSLFLILGLLTRVAAAVLASLAGISVILYAANRSAAETAFLYCGACIALGFGGSGSYALDALLRVMTPRRPSKPRISDVPRTRATP